MSESGGIRRCANRCSFCFVDGLPKGLRPSLYVKDDDILHSFLFGNFVTLTNLRESDWQRLQAQRLSPLFVSVHTTDRELRRKMLGNPKAPDILEQLRRLGGMRIQVHAQIVLCPGVNDGDNLTQTIEDLATLHPTIQSVAVVPVGITRHTIDRKGELVTRHSSAQAKAVIDGVVPLQRRFRDQIGVSLVYLADEFYLMAGVPIPAAARYDGFPQIENGIGLTRKMLEEWRHLKRKLGASSISVTRRIAVVTGTLIASTFSRVIDDLGQICQTGLDLVPVANAFFGPTVTVSGLLTGADVISAFRQRGNAELLILPRNMLNADGERCLDGLTPEDIGREVGARVVAARNLREMIAACQEA